VYAMDYDFDMTLSRHGGDCECAARLL